MATTAASTSAAANGSSTNAAPAQQASGGQSRLDRLVTLLDTGSTTAVRSTAARQLGQIAAVRVGRGDGSSVDAASSSSSTSTAKANLTSSSGSTDKEAKPTYRGTDGEWGEALHLLARVLPYLRSPSWDTRTAAGHAIELICAACGIWDPRVKPATAEASSSTTEDALAPPPSQPSDLMTFASFSLADVCSKGTKLLSSAGSEYDVASGATIAERLANAKRDMERLGLGGMAGEEMDLGIDVEQELGAAEALRTSESQLATTRRDSSTKTTLPPPRFAPLPPGKGLPPPRFAPQPSPSGSATSSPKITSEVTFAAASPVSSRGSAPPPPAAAPTVTTPSVEMAEPDLSKLSARERNQLKRKRKLGLVATVPAASSSASLAPASASPGASESKTRVVDSKTVSTSGSTPSDGVRIRSANWTGTTTGEGASTPGSATEAPAATAAAVTPTSLVAPAGVWPFATVCALLQADLFSPKWEIRHGAALGLRSLLTTQGACSGMVSHPSVTEADNEARHAAWCADMSIRLLCVLSLDRLGDFVFDQVVTPVRETTAQALAALLKHMPRLGAQQTHAKLMAMVRQDWVLPPGENKHVAPGLPAGRKYKGYAWEVRHAGLLGLRWEVTVRPDLLVEESTDEDVEMAPVRQVKEEELARPPSKILRRIVELSVQCLRDEDDDVRNVAAQTLLPVVNQLVTGMPDELPSVLAQLWNCLEDLKDDLSSSTGGVMDLLAKLVQHPQVIALLTSSSTRPLTELLPRLFPFFRHTITSVRLSLLNALNVFLGVQSLPRGWIDARLLRLLFQNLIVEERPAIRSATAEAWGKAVAAIAAEGQGDALTRILGPFIRSFFRILMTSLGSPFDFTLFYQASTSGRQTHNIDKHVLAQDMTLIGVDTIVRGRLGAAQALGSVMSYWPAHGPEAAQMFGKMLSDYINSTAALHRCLAAVVVQEWAEAATARNIDLSSVSSAARSVGQQLITHLEAPAPSTYMEMAVMLQRIQLDAQGLYNSAARDCKVAKAVVPTLPSKVDPLSTNGSEFTIETAQHVAGKGLEELLAQSSSVKARKAGEAAVEERRRKLLVSIGFYQSTKEQQDTQVFASVAGAVIALKMLPAKLNPVIRSIMNSVKFEENVELQMRSARSVASFVALCSAPGARANPSDKIIKNLCAFVCQDTSRTPIFASAKAELEGITSMREAPAPTLTGRSQVVVTETEEARKSRLIRRGAEVTLKELAARFGEALFDKIPTLWACSSEALLKLLDAEPLELSDEEGQFILDACTLVQVVMPELHLNLRAHMLQLLQPLTVAIQSMYAVVRGAAAKALSVMADCAPETVMQHIVEHVVPYLGDARNVTKRQGAVETVSQIVRLLDIKLLPYVIVLIVPVLGRMGDSDEIVRLMATNTFALLVKMVPLEAGLPDPPGLSRELMERREHERKFLAQLLDGSKVEPYQMPVKVNAELRSYQRDGVSWMAFLAKYQLHGILCDDMGLGKTLQSICILSAQHYERAQRFDSTQSPDSAPLPSLIVCPPTLTGHWFHEIKQYSTNLRPLMYVGQPQERVRLQGQIEQYDVIVTSYETVRNDVAALSKFNWLYCVLDEGHVIKSGKTKTSKAVKSIKANHRLLLSGTPIQNNVLELWSLFDFLMPGFLGTERAFNERFGKPIVALRDGKVTAREQESASLALDALHKQVLPFLLRRLKEDVLDDLPPKIIQDIECDLGSVQKQLYDEYSRAQARQDLTAGTDDAGGEGKQHVFQTLQYLRKLVNHPKLVFDKQNAKHREIEASLVKNGGSLRDITHAPKLQALKQLLNDCGIGQSETADAGSSDVLQLDAAVSQHRVLIFCQLKQMLDIIETDLFKTHMPSVSYIRLDGSVAADKRHGVVQTFNADPSIDVLLLTTQVGGLGLTLTGADTVIFVEHDWNPMKDLQAMDRAHRLGQKKVVNVYRLITRNTLEAKIMGLQRFKLHVAGSVVTQQNAGLESMQTDQVLDLFDTSGGEAAATARTKSTGAISQKALLEAIENAPDTGDDYIAAAEWKA